MDFKLSERADELAFKVFIIVGLIVLNVACFFGLVKGANEQ